MDQFPPDCLPPEGIYPTRDALFKAINDWALPRGYAFTTGKSTKHRNGRIIVTFACDRARQPPSASKQRMRNTTTRGCGCPFSILGKQLRDEAGWAICHRQDARFAIHNHEPSSHPTAHPIHRKLSAEDKTTISSLTSAGVAPKEIRTYLRQNSTTLATQKDISNQIMQSRRDTRQGENTIHALANQLDEEGFWSRMQLDADNRVEAILFAHPDSLTYLQAYPDLLLLDCTYKTNRYGMPLLDIIGIDASNRSFCIAFAFLRGEDEEDYLWALERLKSLYEICQVRLPSVILTDCAKACMNAVDICFPSSISLLCLWHANKAVLTNCRPTFILSQRGLSLSDDGDAAWQSFFSHWHSIIYSSDQATFEQRVQELEQQYLPTYVNEVAYLKSTWLNPYKQKLVKAWVDQHLHFSTVVTSTVEGIHSMLKSYLKTSKLDLFEAWGALRRALVHQLAELRSNQAMQQVRNPVELSKNLYSGVQSWVSHYALRKVEEQRKRLLDNEASLPSCTGVFTRTQGLPCAHILQPLQEQGQALHLDHFHEHWHLNRPGKPQLLLEPRTRVEAMAARSNLPLSSTKRYPSSFEAIEVIGKRKAPPKCGRCHTLGHMMTSKACPLRHQELLEKAAADRQAQEASPADAQALTALLITDEQEYVALHTKGLAATSAEAMISSPIEALATSPIRAVTPLAYDSPQAIYKRYVAAREAWYKMQPRGAIKTNQEYRKAQGLPSRYGKANYAWCCDWKQMNSSCLVGSSRRPWTKEEMMAYLDWTKLEDQRVEDQVGKEMEAEGFATRRRGMNDIWEAAAQDHIEQQRKYR